MVEAAYRAAGLDARYINCEVDPVNLGAAVGGARAMGWAGFNCSIPHKVAVIAHLDELAPSASIIGAVNCVVRRDGRLVGENTDGQGFLASLRTVVDPAGKHVVVFGAGGAARAITVETALAGAASITVVNVNPERGRRARPAPQRAHTGCCDVRAVGRAAPPSRVSATSSSTPHRSVCSRTSTAQLDLDLDSLRPHMVVADVIPNPPTHAPPGRRCGSRLPDVGRARDARQPGRARHQAVDRRRCRRRRDARNTPAALSRPEAIDEFAVLV